MWHYSCTVQWNPALWTPLKNIHLRYCAHFVWSRMHFTHACVRSEPMKCRNPPVLRNADKFPSSSNSWTVQNSLNNPDAHLPLCKIMCHIWWIAHCAIFSRPCMANSKVWKCSSPARIHIPRPPQLGAPLYPDFPHCFHTTSSRSLGTRLCLHVTKKVLASLTSTDSSCDSLLKRVDFPLAMFPSTAICSVIQWW